MKRLILLLCILGVACESQQKDDSKASTQEVPKPVQIPSYSFEEMESMLHQKDEKIHVVNFWATFCKPCVEELPFFKQLSKEKSVDLLLVSTDMPKMKDSHLKPFLKKNDIESKVVLLDDPNSNLWIPKVDEDWDGAIPATLVYTDSNRIFKAGQFSSFEELKKFVKYVKNEKKL